MATNPYDTSKIPQSDGGDEPPEDSTGESPDEYDDDDDDNSEQNDEKKILEIALKRFHIAEEAESEIRQEAIDDLRFRAGEQWPEQIRHQREIDKRPCLTFNRLPQYIRQITNEQRQNPTSIKINPVDSDASVDTAKVLEGLIRHVEYVSNADVAYETALEGAASKGFGYFRVVTDYSDPESFQQEIFIRRIRNSFSVFLDPNSQEPDGSDANWGFVIDDMSIDDYKNQYPKSKLATAADWETLGNEAPGWASKESCRIAEYFYKEFRKENLVQLNNGQAFLESELPELPEGIQIVNKRETEVYEIKWCKINAIEILEKTIWPGLWIPIIPVYGDELYIEGRRVLEGVTRHAKDAQRMYNYWASSETEMIALAPKAPFIAAEGQIEGHEEEWRTANVVNHSVLEYKPKTAGGVTLPAPQRQTFEPAVQAITQARMQANEDIKATTGIYDSELGNRSNEQSGVAIERRNAQSQISNFHFSDNLNRSIKHGGRIVLDLIPKIYDTPMAARIIHEDGTHESVILNQIFQKDGKTVQHNLGIGKYDVTVASGPSFTTKRQEAVAAMIELSRAYPAIMQIAGDLLVKNMDWPSSQEVGDRLKAMLPPQIQSQINGQKQPVDPRTQAMLQQQGQMIQTLTQHLNDATAIINTKNLEIKSKERIEFAKMNTDLTKKIMELDSKEAIKDFEQATAHIDRRLDLLDVGQPMPSVTNPSAGSPQGMAPGNQQPTGGQPPGLPMGG